jgi:hypothetical protein
MAWILTILVLLGAEVLGILLLYSLQHKESEIDLPGLFGLSFGAGTGMMTLGMFILAYWHLPITPARWLALWAILIFILGIRILFSPFKFKRWFRQMVQRSAIPKWDRLCTGLLALICLIWAMTLIDSISQPLTTFDARAIWAMKAKSMAEAKTIHTEDFLEPARLHAHQRYPLLLPLAECAIFQLAGFSDDRYVKPLFPAFFGALLLLFFSSARRSRDPLRALLTTAALAVLPVYSIFANGGVSSGYADLPLSYFALAAAICLWDFCTKGGRGSLILFILLGASTAFIKNEGLALLVILVLTALLFLPFAIRCSLCTRLVICLGSFFILLILLPWFDFRRQLPNIDEDYLSRFTPQLIRSGLARIPFVAKSYFRELFLKPHLWNIATVLFLGSLIRIRKFSWRAGHHFFLLVPLAYHAILFAIFLVTPWNIAELIPITLTRLWLQVMPMIFLWFAFQFPLGHSQIE